MNACLGKGLGTAFTTNHIYQRILRISPGKSFSPGKFWLFFSFLRKLLHMQCKADWQFNPTGNERCRKEKERILPNLIGNEPFWITWLASIPGLDRVYSGSIPQLSWESAILGHQLPATISSNLKCWLRFPGLFQVSTGFIPGLFRNWAENLEFLDIGFQPFVQTSIW